MNILFTLTNKLLSFYIDDRGMRLYFGHFKAISFFITVGVVVLMVSF